MSRTVKGVLVGVYPAKIPNDRNKNYARVCVQGFPESITGFSWPFSPEAMRLIAVQKTITLDVFLKTSGNKNYSDQWQIVEGSGELMFDSATRRDLKLFNIFFEPIFTGKEETDIVLESLSVVKRILPRILKWLPRKIDKALLKLESLSKKRLEDIRQELDSGFKEDEIECFAVFLKNYQVVPFTWLNKFEKLTDTTKFKLQPVIESNFQRRFCNSAQEILSDFPFSVLPFEKSSLRLTDIMSFAKQLGGSNQTDLMTDAIVMLAIHRKNFEHPISGKSLYFPKENTYLSAKELCMQLGTTRNFLESTSRCYQLLEHYDTQPFTTARYTRKVPLVTNWQRTIDEDRVYSTQTYLDEKVMAHFLYECIASPDIPVNTEVLRSYEEEELPYRDLSSEQILAVKAFISRPLSILTGGAGSGKTQTTVGIINSYRAITGPQASVLVLAASGNAVKRCIDCLRDKRCGGVTVMTIHRYLCSNKSICMHLPGYQCTESEKGVHNILCIVDEASMIGLNLFARMLSRRKFRWMVLVGDPNQLEPVCDLGSPFLDMITLSESLENKGAIPVTRLTRSFRQGSDSNILNVSSQILHFGIFTPRPKDVMSDFLVVISEKIPLLSEVLPKLRSSLQIDFSNLQLLANRNQECLDLNIQFKHFIKTGNYLTYMQLEERRSLPWKFQNDDKIVIRKNIYITESSPYDCECKVHSNPSLYGKIFETTTLRAANGSRGSIKDVQFSPNGYISQIMVRLDGDKKDIILDEDCSKCPEEESIEGSSPVKPVKKKKESESDIDSCIRSLILPAYCITVHKSQGSEYDNVAYFNFGSSKSRNCKAGYTAITRAKKKCALISSLAKFADSEDRVSHIKQRVEELLSSKSSCLPASSEGSEGSECEEGEGRECKRRRLTK
jgi:hypothetical protein